MRWYRSWYPWFGSRGWWGPHWHRRRFWRPRPFFWGPAGCGCLPLFIVLGLVLFVCLASMCSGPSYYWY
jgi:hypothetical protein